MYATPEEALAELPSLRQQRKAAVVEAICYVEHQKARGKRLHGSNNSSACCGPGSNDDGRCALLPALANVLPAMHTTCMAGKAPSSVMYIYSSA
jgi:hypothetical protein